jgi:hypothetical protein
MAVGETAGPADLKVRGYGSDGAWPDGSGGRCGPRGEHVDVFVVFEGISTASAGFIGRAGRMQLALRHGGRGGVDVVDGDPGRIQP